MWGEGCPSSPCPPCPASLLSLQGRCLRRPRAPAPQTHALQGPSAMLQRTPATPACPQSPRAVPVSHATTGLCVCPRAQGPMTSAATVCLDSRVHTVSWTSTSARPGPAATGPLATTWPIATSATAPSAMKVMAPAVPGGLCNVGPVSDSEWSGREFGFGLSVETPLGTLAVLGCTHSWSCCGTDASQATLAALDDNVGES